jgi:MraZ protein
MFFGRYRHAVDSKNRISIPGRLRDRFIVDGSRQVAVFVGFEGCLWCYPLEEWRVILRRLNRLSFDRVDVRDLIRWLSSRGTEVELDAQGRIQLAEEQLRAVGIDGEAVVVGVGARVEIWSVERFEERRARTDGAGIAEGIFNQAAEPDPAERGANDRRER